MSYFEVGDKVETIDDTISGIVIVVKMEEIIIEDINGFEFHYAPKELVKITGNNAINITELEAARIKEEDRPQRKQTNVPKPKERNVPKMEVDLHINQLVRYSKRMDNHEMLTLQLDTAKRQLEFAIQKRIQKVVFIHGVGEGVLKEELKYLFKRYENISYYDADYQKYGSGATEVYIYQNT